jgi:hypothetical protein
MHAPSPSQSTHRASAHVDHTSAIVVIANIVGYSVGAAVDGVAEVSVSDHDVDGVLRRNC